MKRKLWIAESKMFMKYLDKHFGLSIVRLGVSCKVGELPEVEVFLASCGV